MTISDYSDYKIEEFIEDSYFRRWVFENDASLDFFWQAFLRKNPEKESTINEARKLLLDMQSIFHEETERNDFLEKDMTEVFETAMLKGKAFEKAATINKIVPKPNAITGHPYRSAAACFLILMACSFGLYFQVSSENRIEYVTGNGQWETIVLPDGSTVELNANSQLSLLNEWKEGEDRTVWLKGEAFFEVEKKLETNAKFSVVTKDLRVDVFGTEFNVNTRHQQTEVFLEEGLISLEIDNKKTVIEPGEFIAYSQELNKVTERFKDESDMHSKWKHGVFHLRNASMREIQDEVELLYGIDLIVDNKEVNKKQRNIAIPVDDLGMATAILEKLFNVKIEKKGKQYFIK